MNATITSLSLLSDSWECQESSTIPNRLMYQNIGECISQLLFQLVAMFNLTQVAIGAVVNYKSSRFTEKNFHFKLIIPIYTLIKPSTLKTTSKLNILMIYFFWFEVLTTGYWVSFLYYQRLNSVSETFMCFSMLFIVSMLCVTCDILVEVSGCNMRRLARKFGQTARIFFNFAYAMFTIVYWITCLRSYYIAETYQDMNLAIKQFFIVSLTIAFGTAVFLTLALKENEQAFDKLSSAINTGKQATLPPVLGEAKQKLRALLVYSVGLMFLCSVIYAVAGFASDLDTGLPYTEYLFYAVTTAHANSWANVYQLLRNHGLAANSSTAKKKHLKDRTEIAVSLFFTTTNSVAHSDTQTHADTVPITRVETAARQSQAATVMMTKKVSSEYVNTTASTVVMTKTSLDYINTTAPTVLMTKVSSEYVNTTAPTVIMTKISTDTVDYPNPTLIEST